MTLKIKDVPVLTVVTVFACLLATHMAMSEDVKPASEGISTETGEKTSAVDIVKKVDDKVVNVPPKGPVLTSEEIKPMNLQPELESNKKKKRRQKTRITFRIRDRKNRKKKRMKKKMLKGENGVSKLDKKKTKFFKKNKNARNRKARLLNRKQSIVDRIVEENKAGKPSTISTEYLRKRIRELLESEGLIKPSNCEPDRKAKTNIRKKLLRRKLIANRKNRKQARNLKSNLRNKNRRLKAKKTRTNKIGKNEKRNKKNKKNKKVDRGPMKGNRGRKGRRNKRIGGDKTKGIKEIPNSDTQKNKNPQALGDV